MMVTIMVIIKNNNPRDGYGAAWGVSEDPLCLKNRTPARSDGEAQRASAQGAWGLQRELKGTQEHRRG